VRKSRFHISLLIPLLFLLLAGSFPDSEFTGSEYEEFSLENQQENPVFHYFSLTSRVQSLPAQDYAGFGNAGLFSLSTRISHLYAPVFSKPWFCEKDERKFIFKFLYPFHFFF